MSWHFSRALVAGFSGVSSSDGEPSAPLKLNHTPSAYYCNDKTKEFSRLFRFGMTFEHLTADRGAELLMLFLEGFRVKTFHLPVKEPELPENAPDYGRNSPESSVRHSLVTFSSKTPLFCEPVDWRSYWKTLPRWGSMRNGVLSERITPELLTNGTESGYSVPTTTCNPEAPNKNANTKGPKSLLEYAKFWPTPKHSDPDRGGRGDLLAIVRWKPNKHCKSWPTPCRRDYKGANAPEGMTRKDGKSRTDQLPNAVLVDGGTSTPPTNQGQLNPAWVEWLMGWPVGWTDLKPLGTDKFRKWLESHGIC